MTLSSRGRIIVIAMAIIAVASAYFIFDPVGTKWAPKCMFHLVTGWDCPGCGSQRMIHALLHGDFRTAWGANPFFICMLPVLAVMGYAAVFREKKPRFYAAVNSIPVIITIAAALILWGILRNVF